MDDLSALEDWAGALLARMEPAARRAVASDIGKTLRRSQQARIRAQQNPDGSQFEPRKTRQVMERGRLREKKGRIKREMFTKLRTAKFFKNKNDASGVTVGFAGRIARLARIHQEGERSPVVQSGPAYQYPVRQLLGLTPAERDMIRDKLMDHLAN
ncbi:MAG: phage virion morphogenesis protein [Duganella sp.]